MSEMGWCVGPGGGKAIPATKEDCETGHGTWTKEHPGGCVAVVVTAALGSEGARKIKYMRDLRDCMLLKEPAAFRLWDTYSPIYYQLGAPIADALERDPTLRKLLQTFIIDLVLEALSVNAAVEDSTISDGLLRNLVRSGSQQFKDNLRALDADHGEELARAVFDCLKEVKGDVE